MIFVRPCRKATVRTRLDAGAVRERLSALVADPGPRGFARWRAHGFFVGGRVEAKEFTVEYKLANFKNPQTYAIHGALEEAEGWRILRLRLTAHSPWASWVELGVLAALLLFLYTFGAEDMSPAGAIGVFLFVMGMMALVNLLYIPSAVNRRVAAIVARQVDGNLQRGDAWVAP